MIKTSITELREKLADLLNQVSYGGERISIHRHGKATAVVVTLEDWELLEAIESRLESDEVKQLLRQLNGSGPVFAVKHPYTSASDNS